MILISTPNSWQAYYWWLDDDRAPAFARTVDIHRKPGYDPVELYLRPGHEEHSARRHAGQRLARRPADDRSQRTVLLASEPMLLPGPSVADTDVFGIVLRRAQDADRVVNAFGGFNRRRDEPASARPPRRASRRRAA